MKFEPATRSLRFRPQSCYERGPAAPSALFFVDRKLARCLRFVTSSSERAAVALNTADTRLQGGMRLLAFLTTRLCAADNSDRRQGPHAGPLGLSGGQANPVGLSDCECLQQLWLGDSRCQMGSYLLDLVFCSCIGQQECLQHSQLQQQQ